MKVSLNKINDINALKSFGSYRHVKGLIEESLGIPVKVNSWENLFNFINNISLAIDRNREQLDLLKNKSSLQEIGSFLIVKKQISELLSFSIKTRSWEKLQNTLDTIMLAFTVDAMTTRESIFEKNKLRNFIHSSKLEGIEINYTPNLKMEDVLNKYRVKES